MKKLAIATVLLATLTTPVWANCWTETYIINGKMITCQVCQTGSMITRNCM